MKYLPQLLACLLACLLTISQPAAAWGKKGHATIAEIAEANLTPAARAQVQALLKNDLDSHGKLSGRTTLADVASWADEIRKTAPENTYRGWHMRSNSVCTLKLGACWLGACVDQKLLHYAAVLKDKSAPLHERNEALKFVVHLVGDLHTPLHSGSNRDSTGHFPVTLEGRKNRADATLHSAWDHDLLSMALKGHSLTAKLEATEKLPSDAVVRWMLETRDVSRKHVYDPLPGFVCNTPATGPVVLPRAYQEQALPAIRQQVERAGLRLAQLLNELLN